MPHSRTTTKRDPGPHGKTVELNKIQPHPEYPTPSEVTTIVELAKAKDIERILRRQARKAKGKRKHA